MRKIFVVIFALALLSSCGVMTKTRYGNGLKLDLGNNILAKKDKETELKAEKAIKKGVEYSKPIFQNSIAKEPNKVIIQQDTLIRLNDEVKNNTSFKKDKKPLKWIKEIKDNVISKPLNVKYNDAPFEKNAIWAGILFYGGVLLGLTTIFPLISGLMVLIGFILAIVSLGKIKKSGGLYRGKGLAISIVVIFGLFILSIVFYIALFLAIFL